MKKLKNNLLLKNTVMLYVLQFSSYFFSLITVPYQTRVLGPAVYGNINFAVAAMTYFQLFLDFGFLLSATEDISKNRNDREYINRRLTSITVLKLFLVLLSVAAVIALCIFVPRFATDPKLFIVYLAAYAVNAFMPDFLYRGIEKMTAITVRTVIIKLFFTIMIFAFMREADDYMVIPILLLIGNTGAVVGAYLHLFKTMGYSFGKITFADIRRDFRRSLVFFASRIATTVYSATNTLIIGFLDGTGVVTGYYSSADKLLNTAKNGLSPISDSLYPYMVRNRDFKLVKKVLLIFCPVIVLGCIGVGIFARPLCELIFGKEFGGAAPVLVAMLPAIAAILPSYVLGFPTLGAMGLSQYANFSVVVGTITYIVGIGVLLLTDGLSVIALAALTSLSEWAILLFRVAIVVRNRKSLTDRENTHE